jgi:hypothetical protein
MLDTELREQITLCTSFSACIQAEYANLSMKAGSRQAPYSTFSLFFTKKGKTAPGAPALAKSRGVDFPLK